MHKLSLTTAWKYFKQDSLFRNSVYLMASMGVIGVSGFFFWIIVARIFPPGSVGIATALISVMSLISNFSLLGFNISLVRYLPTSSQRNPIINSTLLLVTIMSILVSLVFLIGLKIFSPHLVFLQTKMFYSITFVLFVIGASVNTLSESIFMAYRVSINVLIKNVILSFLKITFPFILIFFGAYGIFLSVSLATTISLLVAFCILFIRYNYVPSISFNGKVIREMAIFSGGNYIGSFLSQAPGLILPVLIINALGPETAAYYYISSMILAFLMIISQSTTQALLAEASHDITRVKEHFLKSLLIIFSFLIPSIFVIFFFGGVILHAFGKSYAMQAFGFLQIISFSSLFISISSLGNSLLRLRHQIKDLVLLNLINAIVVLGFSCFFIHKGLTAVGWAWLVGEGLVALVYILVLWKKKYL